MEDEQLWKFLMVESSTNPASYSVRLLECTIRARVAFVLAIAEWARTTIETDKVAAARVRSALDLAWQWQQTAKVSGEALQDTVEGEEESEVGLAFDEPMAPDAQKPAWCVVIDAVCYTCWHAYVAGGDKRGMSEAISEVTEEIIDQTVKDARQVLGFDQGAVDRLAQYCIDHHRSTKDNELGAAISREVMLQAANWST